MVEVAGSNPAGSLYVRSVVVYHPFISPPPNFTDIKFIGRWMRLLRHQEAGTQVQILPDVFDGRWSRLLRESTHPLPVRLRRETVALGAKFSGSNFYRHHVRSSVAGRAARSLFRRGRSPAFERFK